MADQTEVITRESPRQRIATVFRPTRSQLEGMQLAAGSDPHKDIDRHLDLNNECLARLHGRSFTFNLKVHWLYQRADFDAIGEAEAARAEHEQLALVGQSAGEAVLRKLVGMIVAGTWPEGQRLAVLVDSVVPLVALGLDRNKGLGERNIPRANHIVQIVPVEAVEEALARAEVPAIGAPA